jgi:glycosyltransferase involved in cell wall biosynthesis
MYAKDFVSALERYYPNEITEINVLTHTEGIKTNEHEIKGKVHVFKLFDSLSFGRNLAFVKILFKVIKIHPDLVHLQYSTIPNGRYGGLLGESLFILFLFLKIMRIPLYITLHSLWLPKQAEERINEKNKNKYLSKLAKWYLKIFTFLFSLFPKKLFLLVNIKGSKLAEEFCHGYHISKNRIKEETLGVWSEKKYRVSELEAGKRRKNKMVCLGVLNPSKGYEFTIRAMKEVLEKFPDSSLVIAGSAPPTNYDEGKKYIDTLHSIVKDLGLSKSVFILERYISDNEFTEYLRTSAIVLLSYSRIVGGSSIMHEAMRYEVPIVATGSGLGFEELSEFIPLVSPKNPSAIANEIIKILGSDNYRRTLVGNYDKYISEHDWSIVIKDFIDEYTTLK